MKVLVGLSGGVDSAIAAYLLKEQGHDVTCCFMRNWDSMANNDFLGNPTIEDDVCPQEKDYMDAKSVADSLGLDLLRVDFVKEYWDHVFACFLNEYKKGRTPNPDILCNKYIKFDSFLQYAKARGFEAIATGHYAKKEIINGQAVMKKAHDLNKDQTYFLCQISRDALAYTLFPLGEIDKPQVREYAQKLELSIARKKDSTGICFIGERNFRAFLQNYLPSKPGNIIDIDSKRVLKKHEGVLFYTIGQRKGLDIGGAGGPWFVVGKDVIKNELYVASGDDNVWLLSNSCIVSDVNWLCDVEDKIECCAKFRYRQMDNPVILEKIDATHVRLTYNQGVKAVTSGQEAVFYHNDICLGGGVIDQVYYNGITMEERLKEKLQGNAHE